MSTLGEIIDVLEDAYPRHWAEDWDRVGLVLGVRAEHVDRVLLAVDPTVAVAREAVDRSAQLLVTHHPLLLRGASFLPADEGKGAVVTTLLRAGVGLWCGHTNVDRSREGTVGGWVDALDLRGERPLVPAREQERDDLFGLGVIGQLPAATTVAGLAQRIADRVPATAQGIRYTGDPDREVRTVAICPGAGDSFLGTVVGTGADVYITSDLRHHPALEHIESAADPLAVPALIDVAHSASEALWLPRAHRLLSERIPGLHVGISEISTDPFTGRVDRSA